ncbi:lysophospholipid acyltransferase family protein [Ancylobacter terrae]|uniref:lysophospholipid acyltransferase family protein n=1 Tax=Ancylobacter sp. sgz301288 TaxID=3342077 RepID=UPI00385D12A9
MWRKLRSYPHVRRMLGRSMAAYLRFVWRTSRVTLEPADLYDRAERELPMIVTFWHGQHFLTPFVTKPHHRGRVMISRSEDADINAIAAEALGIGTIRGSGANMGGRRARARDFNLKGGVDATRQMIESLNEGVSVAMTADVPKIARVAGLGVVTIARHSGRPIYPVAIASRHRIVARSWDKASINLPFGPVALVAGDGVRVPADADAAALEAARLEVQRQLEAATERAEELVGLRPRTAAGAAGTPHG